MHLTKEEKRKWMPGQDFYVSVYKSDFFVGISHVFCFILLGKYSPVMSLCSRPWGSLVTFETTMQ